MNKSTIPLSDTITRHELTGVLVNPDEQIRMQDLYIHLANVVRDAMGVGDSSNTTGIKKLRDEFKSHEVTDETNERVQVARANVSSSIFEALDDLEDLERAQVMSALLDHLKEISLPYLKDEVDDFIRGTSSTPELDGMENADEVRTAYQDAINIKGLLDQMTFSFSVKELKERGFKIKESNGKRRWNFPTLPNPEGEKKSKKSGTRAANRLPVFTLNGQEFPHGMNFAELAKKVRTPENSVGARDIQGTVEKNYGKDWRDSEWEIEVNGFTIHGSKYLEQK